MTDTSLPQDSPLKERIRSRHAHTQQQFSQNHPHAQLFFQDKGLDLGKIRQHSARLLTAGALTGALFLNSPKPHLALPAPTLSEKWAKVLIDAGWVLPEDSQSFLISSLKELLPLQICPLSAEEEKKIGLLIERLTGIRARANLEGEHLNTCFGLIGAEQHLPRFPGDGVSLHDAFRESGITQGLGAWGYFAQSKPELKPIDVEREKYYVAVQTLYLPDWEKRLKYLRDWYKFRKVLVLNPQNGQAVVATIADAGPAAWTGKQFGGSPELMSQLGLDKGPRKGSVLLLFVDDPENKVALGPVDYDSKIDLPRVAITKEEKI